MDEMAAITVKLVAVPESFVSCLMGFYDTLQVASTAIAPARINFDVEIVALADPVESRTRRFRQATGHSPPAYLQRTRVDRAKDLLERTADPVEEICWAVGHDDPASFRRLFKRITAVTPGAYRRKFAGA